MMIIDTFEALLLIDDNEVSIEEIYNTFKDTTNSVTQDVVGRNQPKQVNGMTRELYNACERIRKA